tara:strand:+ start:5829 stop:6680 length:852 start_codon:yes stop_codon:yes gene_type:complete
MITYNQEVFIRDAIEGVLMQHVNFPVELLIADDTSPISTSLIVQEYIENHPKGHWIRYVRHSENKGMMGNFVWALENCKGKYIALCEGDDYWTDPLKLKKQVEFLELNKNYSLVSHYSKKISFKNNISTIIGKLDRDNYSLEDIDYHFLPIPTASICFRKSFFIPDWFFQVYGGDRALIFLCSQHGKVKIMDFIGSVYRVHEDGIEQKYKKDKFSLPIRNLQELKTYNKLATERFKSKIMRKIAWNHFYLSFQYVKVFKIKRSINNLLNSIYWKSKFYFYKYD